MTRNMLMDSPVASTPVSFTVYPLFGEQGRRTIHLGRMSETMELVNDATKRIHPFALVRDIPTIAWAAWQRSLREALGHADGISDPVTANRRGRDVLSDFGIMRADWQEMRERVQDEFESWIRQSGDALLALGATGVMAPDVRTFDIAVATHDRLVPLTVVSKKGSSSRNVAALGLRVAGPETVKSGRFVDAVQAYLGYWEWPEKVRGDMWTAFLGLAATTAAEMDADRAHILELVPRPSDAEIGRLTPGIFVAASEFLQNRDPADALPRKVVQSFILRATDGTDHGVLIEKLDRFTKLARSGIAAKDREKQFGGMLRALEAREGDRQHALTAESQKQEADGDERRWGTGIEPHLDGEFELIELTTPQALVAEGEAMHHCVGTYASRCEDGTSTIWSVRKLNRRIATADLTPPEHPGGRWHVAQLFGLRNTPPSSEVVAVVEQLTARHRGVAKQQKEANHV